MAAIPAKMTAIGISKPGAPDVLVPEERPVPQPGHGEVLVNSSSGGRQPARPGSAQGHLSAAERCDRYSWA